MRDLYFGRGIGKYQNWGVDLAVRVEPYPILSAAVSTTESSSRNLSRFTASHFEALERVMPPLHGEEELMNEELAANVPHKLFAG